MRVHAQQVEIMFREEIGYQKFMRRAGAKGAVEVPYILVPLNLSEAVGRLIAGLR